MNNEEKLDEQSMLFKEIENVLHRARHEYDLTYPEIIGILEVHKAIALEQQLDLMQEDGEGMMA